jgi:hypothetical protein
MDEESAVVTKIGDGRYAVGRWVSPNRFVNYWFDAIDELDAYRQYLNYMEKQNGNDDS